MLKASGADLRKLRDAAISLKASNQQLAIHSKIAKASKETFAKWLKEKRGIDVETLKIGDQVIIEGVLQIEVTQQNKFDESAFLSAQPEEHAKWKKDLPVRKFKALV